uniref:Uncharacterized protein n=1 Tax=Micrurus carvalhoi TaxID=3147026 RepID=A0A2H6N8E1_9SAUR
MIMAGTLTVWTNEKDHRAHAFSMNFGVCIEENGVFFLCGKNAYLCLPTNWTGTCTIVHLFPKIGVVSGEQTLPIPLMGHVRKRVPLLVPLLAIMGIGTAIGTGVGRLTHSIIQFQQLSEEFQESLNQIAGTLVEVQDQIDSLAVMVLQNRRAIDLQTAKKRGFVCIPGRRLVSI